MREFESNIAHPHDDKTTQSEVPPALQELGVDSQLWGRYQELGVNPQDLADGLRDSHHSDLNNLGVPLNTDDEAHWSNWE